MNSYTDTVTIPLCIFHLIMQQKQLLENADRHIIKLNEIAKKAQQIAGKKVTFSVYKKGELVMEREYYVK